MPRDLLAEKAVLIAPKCVKAHLAVLVAEVFVLPIAVRPVLLPTLVVVRLLLMVLQALQEVLLRLHLAVVR